VPMCRGGTGIRRPEQDRSTQAAGIAFGLRRDARQCAGLPASLRYHQRRPCISGTRPVRVQSPGLLES
jgi:hypothetical protein